MSKHCCSEIEYHLTKARNVENDVDVIVEYTEVFDEYGIPIHDGGSSKIHINFCPWCGTKFPESKRDLWFDTLEKLGFNEPFFQDIPDEFKSDKWYKKIS